MKSASSAVGLLGGSFDPIHLGHLRLARAAQDDFDLAEVRFVPAGQPWQKSGLASAAARAAMVEQAIASAGADARFRLDRRELDRAGATYTIDTLRELRVELGPAAPLVFLIGADQLHRFDTWHDWDSILDFAHLAVAPRPGEPPAPLAAHPRLAAWWQAHHADPAALQAPAGAIVEIAMAPDDVSATEVRALLRAPRSTDGDARLGRLLPLPVLDYIRAHRLYSAD